MSEKSNLRKALDKKLAQILTYPKLINSINEGKFKEYVNSIRQFKNENKIEGKLRDLIPTENKSTDLKSLANKFDFFIPPPGGPLDRQKIDLSLKQLQVVKKVDEKINKDIPFPSVDDFMEPDKSISGGGVDVEEREM